MTEIKIDSVESSSFSHYFLLDDPPEDGENYELLLVVRVQDSELLTLRLSPSAAIQVSSHLTGMVDGIYNNCPDEVKGIIEQNLRAKGGRFLEGWSE